MGNISTTKNLINLFKPKSVAVIGASSREGSIGNLIMRNLLQERFDGPIIPINPKHKSVAGVLAFPYAEDLPFTPDMAVICTPPRTIPDIIDCLARKGTKAAIIITAGLGSEQYNGDGKTVKQYVLEKAKESDMRILGPNCLGLMVPSIGLNASFSHLPIKSGKIAFVSQSGAMCTAVLDWAIPKGIGFSHFISTGDGIDLDFGNIIDYLGSDPDTRAILLYIESIRERKNFMSAARAASRNKPIIVIKSGRDEEGAKAAASHTGALAGSDDVYETAFQRAGMLRVYGVTELFTAVETLARANSLTGEKLCIVTNGGGIGVMAVDSLSKKNGTLAELSDGTIDKLDQVLPKTWSRANPVDIIGDANGERYEKALEILSEAKEVDALLVMHAPTATADSTEAAEATIKICKGSKKSIITSWVGDLAVKEARRRFNEECIPTHFTPERAVEAFMHMVQYRKNKEMLMETPTNMDLIQFNPATSTIRLIIENVLINGETNFLTEAESKAVFAAYGIPVVETKIARGVKDAVKLSNDMKFPVALKILSIDITHKSDVGGVVLNLNSPKEVKKAGKRMLERVEKVYPNARIQGFTIQEMADDKGSHEIIIGMTTDPVFGPVLLFGHGGTAVEVLKDKTVALPPLNEVLAKELVSRTRISKLMEGYRDVPRVDMDEVYSTLIKISQLVVDFPEISELDINPLFVNEHGVLAVDARIKVERPDNTRDRLAISPYPKQLEEKITLKDGRRALIRPIRPEDEPEHYNFISKLSKEDVRFRFFSTFENLPHSEMARLTQLDYNREMAFIVVTKKIENRNECETLGVIRMYSDSTPDTAEFSIVIRSDWKGKGLGSILMKKMIDYCKSKKIKKLYGEVLSDNNKMLKFLEDYDVTKKQQEDGVVNVFLEI